MHWFWRAVVAVSFGFLFGVMSVGVAERFFRVLTDGILAALGASRTLGLSTGIAVGIVYFIPASILVVCSYSLLTKRARQSDVETRCRKCGYILRGITEPRCPECGERI